MKCLECNNAMVGDKRKKFCNSSCSAKFNNAKRYANGWRPSPEQRKLVSHKLKGKPSPIKGLKLPYIKLPYAKRISKKCKFCGDEFLATEKDTILCCSAPCKRLIVGGCREGSGRSKSGYYKNIYCSSTYELAWVIYRLDNNLPVERFEGYIIYDNNRKYFPDFIDDKHIYEIKGWISPENIDKVNLKCMAAIDAGYTISLLFKDDLKTEFDWVKRKYNYTLMQELYDTHEFRFEYNCSRCDTLFKTNIKRKTKQKICSRGCKIIDKIT